MFAEFQFECLSCSSCSWCLICFCQKDFMFLCFFFSLIVCFASVFGSNHGFWFYLRLNQCFLIYLIGFVLSQILMLCLVSYCLLLRNSWPKGLFFFFFWLQERNPLLSLAACAIPKGLLGLF